jgi:hypothetical protein
VYANAGVAGATIAREPASSAEKPNVVKIFFDIETPRFRPTGRNGPCQWERFVKRYQRFYECVYIYGLT